jgi:hypothetical protein
MPTLSGPEYLNGQFSVAADGTVSLTTPPLSTAGGTISPGPVVIKNNTAPSLPAPPTGTLLQVGNADGTGARILADVYGVTNANFVVRRANGTAAAPSALLNGDVIGAVFASGYGASAYFDCKAGINFYANENWTNTAQGTFLTFRTTPNGTAATAEAMRIDNSGNVGIGTATPQAKLEVNQNAANPALYTGAEVTRFAAADSTACIVGAYSFSGAAGGSAPGVVLHKKRGTGAAPTATQLGDNVGFITWNNFDGTNEHQAATINVTAAENTTSTNAGGILNFNTAGIGQTSVTQRMVIDGNGNVGIGTAAPAASSKLHVLGGGIGEMRVEGTSFAKLMYNINSNATDKKKWQVYGNTTAFLIEALNDTETTSVAAIACQRGAGNTISSVDFPTGTTRNVSGSWTTISDASVKEGVQPYTRGLDAIVALNPVAFRYVTGTPFAEGDKPSRRLFGLIADEVKPHVPEVVGTTTATIGKKENVELSTLEPGNLIYALINAVKELNDQGKEMVARIAALESATVH